MKGLMKIPEVAKVLSEIGLKKKQILKLEFAIKDTTNTSQEEEGESKKS